ncbi:MAG: efflux RND transporter periplasmic adaptor subunit [Muribaculaceae bacterium]|nr:efflux RND transporter periplasmic adaptor subunit [Muribaculaceae bacterium]MDE6027784.1 efflux RND transporter periplasmic adaptor subunit [Muribaculaceae bacterium]
MKIKTLNAMMLPALAVSMLLPSCKGKDAQQQQGPMVPELAVITVGEEDTKLETGIPATLHGENDVEIRPQISGFLTKVHVQEGQHVSKGQVLFTIDQVSLQAAVDAAQAAVQSAQAQVNVAQANVNTAQTNANNNKLLLDKNIISPSAYQTSVDALNAAKAQLNAAKAGLGQANAQLVSARKNLSYSTVTAPVSGIVGVIDNKEGSLVSPQTLLTILSNNSDIEAYFSLNEKDLLNMTDDGKRTIKEAIAKMPEVTLLLANGERYNRPGKVISISGVIDPVTGSASAKALFPNPDGMIRSGSTGQVLIPSLRTNAMLIPQSATFEIQDMKFCYVVGDSSKVHSTPITIADENDGKNYIVTGGLKPGDVIVTEGVGVSVKDNMVIKPKK